MNVLELSQTGSKVVLADALALRVSVRDYTQQAVGKDLIDALLAAAVRAPTAMHQEDTYGNSCSRDCGRSCRPPIWSAY